MSFKEKIKSGVVIVITTGIMIGAVNFLMFGGSDTCKASIQMIDNKAREGYEFLKEKRNESGLYRVKVKRDVVEKQLGAEDNPCVALSIKRMKENYPVGSQDMGKAGEFLVLNKTEVE